MYKITTPAGVTFTTEKPNFIKVHRNGCYILCDRKQAQGVAYGGVPYLFENGTIVSEFDGGSSIDNLNTETLNIYDQLASVDEAAIALYEANILQEEINAEQDEAIIEIYEMMEANNNG